MPKKRQMALSELSECPKGAKDSEHAQRTNVFFTLGARITKTKNPAITPKIARALVALADLAEYHNLGGAPGHELSYMIERSDACLLEHDARLRELVDARRAQLLLWLDAPETKLARKHSRHRKAAKDCLHDISGL